MTNALRKLHPAIRVGQETIDRLKKENVELLRRIARLEAAQQSAHPIVATGCPFCGVSAEDIYSLNESLASDRNGG
jgi:hypothetical protein